MSSNFPTSLDVLSNPTGTTSLNDVNFLHADQHANANDAIEAIEGIVGITGSTVPTSLEYRVANKQALLVSGTNIKTINSTTVLGSGDLAVEVAGAAATAETNAKSYADTLVLGLWDDRGVYDASVNTFPASGGSGVAGAVIKGDIWTISVTGTLGSTIVNVGDNVRALVDTPGQTVGNWAIQLSTLGYVAENITNKVTSISVASTDTQYPSAKLAYDQLALKASLNAPTFTGTVGGITAAMVGAPSGSGASSGTNTGDQTATTVANTPAGSIAATTVQAAINELDTEKAALAGSASQNFAANALTADTVGIGSNELSIFNSVGGNAKLAVTGSSASTDVLGNTNAAIAIINTDNTTENTAGLHFGWQDTDNVPNFVSASIVAILGAKTTGQYAAGQLVFLTSSAAAAAPTEKMRIDSSGLITAAGGFKSIGVSTQGYGTGAGGTVTQTTSKSTAVTINKPTGSITLEATTSIGAGQTVTFQVNNSLVAATDFVHIERNNNGSGHSYEVWIDSVSAGSFIVIVKNYTAGALAESIVLRFLITSSVSA